MWICHLSIIRFFTLYDNFRPHVSKEFINGDGSSLKFCINLKVSLCKRDITEFGVTLPTCCQSKRQTATEDPRLSDLRCPCAHIELTRTLKERCGELYGGLILI